ncbi:hypothetical protein Taro_040462 [Colocasia esculenta]|uniref:Uncharacterized protein n=1 Tax=Colocasia esculenta TaxID=4460 RepID=A0A843WDA8_COLES|nr:hypothetical protein [Colocasia esculenta]
MVRVAMTGRAGIDRSGGNFCGKLLGQSMLPSTVCLVTCDAVVYFLVGRGRCCYLPADVFPVCCVFPFPWFEVLTCGVRLLAQSARATLRLDDWRVGGPQPVIRDVECDSVLCVLLVVVLSRLPWSPFSTV